MTTYAWPTSRHFVPATHELRVIDNTQRTVESSLSGYVQTNAMPGARWGWGMDFTPHNQAQRAELEAYLLRLSGRQHRVRMWDMRNPRPRGSVGLTGVTLGATAAQFATTLTLAGCVGNSMLLGGSFEADTNADGVANGWTRYSQGTVTGLSASLETTSVVHGAKSQLAAAVSLGALETDRHGVYQQNVRVAHNAGRTVELAAWVTATAGAGVALFVAWADSGGASIVGSLYATVVATGALQYVSVSGLCPPNAATCDVYVYQHSGSGGGAYFFVDGAQFVAGVADVYPAPATLLAGDWLGLTGGQLVRVVADATANDAGAMTVEVRHMLRSPVSSGTAVTLDRPTALYVRTEAPLALPRMPGNVEPGLSIDLVEVFS